MSKEKAKAYFLGKDQSKKLNCAQSVGAAFKEKLGISEDMLKQLEKCGAGNAPDGLCGSLFAVKVILEKSPYKFKEIEDNFIQIAGSSKCKEIRASKKLTCLGCVEKCTEFLGKLK